MLWEQTRCLGLTCCLELFSLHFPWAFPQFSDPEEANLLVLSAQPRKDSSETPWCHLWQDAGGSWVAVGTVVSSMCVADVFLPQAAPLSTSPPLHLPPLQAPALPLSPAHPAQQEGQGCSSVVLAGFTCFGKVLPALLLYNWLGELEDQSKVWPLFLSGERGGCCISFWVEMGHLLVAVSFVL